MLHRVSRVRSAGMGMSALIVGTGGFVTGDQFFSWFGRAGSGGRSLPEVRYVFGFSSGHPPVACLNP